MCKRDRRERNRAYVNSTKLERGCESECCPWDGDFTAEQLCFDHVDRSIKKQKLSKLVNDAYSLEVIQAEIDKCIVLCHNCHAVKTKENEDYLELEKDD